MPFSSIVSSFYVLYNNISINFAIKYGSHIAKIPRSLKKKGGEGGSGNFSLPIGHEYLGFMLLIELPII